MHPLEYLFLHHSLLSTIAFFNKETRRAIQKKSNTGRERRWGEQQSWRPGSSRTCRWSGTTGTRHCQVYSCVVYDVTAEKKSLVFSVLGPWTYTQLVLIYYMYHENFREKTESVVQPMLDTRAPRKVKGFEYLNHFKLQLAFLPCWTTENVGYKSAESLFSSSSWITELFVLGYKPHFTSYIK